MNHLQSKDKQFWFSVRSFWPFSRQEGEGQVQDSFCIIYSWPGGGGGGNHQKNPQKTLFFHMEAIFSLSQHIVKDAFLLMWRLRHISRSVQLPLNLGGFVVIFLRPFKKALPEKQMSACLCMLKLVSCYKPVLKTPIDTHQPFPA